MPSASLLDSNILLRMTKNDDPHYAVVRTALQELAAQGTRLCFTSQTLGEFCNASTRPREQNGFGLSIDEADRHARVIERDFALLPDNREVHEPWRQLLVSHEVKGVQVHDARLAASMCVHGLPQLLTINVRDFQRFPSKLSLGWMKLGIVHERIQAGRPQQNGRHERMHRTHKEDTAKPPAVSLRAQQSCFDNFRYVFNNERPHEALNNQVPASLYLPSSIRLPRKLAEFRYPKGLLLRRVNNSGEISWHKNRVFISEVFRFEELGVELTTPGLYRAFFRDMEIGELNSEELRFRAARRVL